MNGDGVVDQRDVELIAMRAVQLRKGKLQLTDAIRRPTTPGATEGVKVDPPSERGDPAENRGQRCTTGREFR